MTQTISLYALIRLPAHQLVEQVYIQLLGRNPSFGEHLHYLLKLRRGYSRKLFVFSVLSSLEARKLALVLQLEGSTREKSLLALFSRGRTSWASIVLKLLYFGDIVTGRAYRFSAQFQTEWQLCIWQECLEQFLSLRKEAQSTQQDVQRRLDLFFLEAGQGLTANGLSQTERDAWLQRLEHATRRF